MDSGILEVDSRELDVGLNVGRNEGRRNNCGEHPSSSEAWASRQMEMPWGAICLGT
jgi:hypothetical protein